MNKHEIARLALKVIAVYALVLFIGKIPMTVWLFSNPDPYSSIRVSASAQSAVMVLPLILLLLIAVGLFSLNRTFAWFLVEYDTERADETPDDARTKQALALSIVGVFLVATALPGVITDTLTLLSVDSYMREKKWAELWPEFLAQLLTVGLGAALFLGGGSVADFWKRLRVLTRPMRDD